MLKISAVIFLGMFYGVGSAAVWNVTTHLVGEVVDTIRDASNKVINAMFPVSESASLPEIKLNITESLNTPDVRYYNYKTQSEEEALTYTFSFSEPKEMSTKCIFNKDNVILEIIDGAQTVAKKTGKETLKPATYNFMLNSNKTIICQAKEESTQARKFQIVVHWIYVPIINSPPASVSTTKDPETAKESGKYTDGEPSFLKRYWAIIVTCCAFVVILCIIAYLVKVLYAKKKSPPPDDYVNLTSDRQNSCPSQTIPNRTIPKVQSNYCDPKDIKGLRSNIEPNYSEAKEPQAPGEGLYAELNRPEDTYAEPYINKNELYAQPIPKAQRRKKDDPNYGNVFGQEYVNSRK